MHLRGRQVLCFIRGELSSVLFCPPLVCTQNAPGFWCNQVCKKKLKFIPPCSRSPHPLLLMRILMGPSWDLQGIFMGSSWDLQGIFKGSRDLQGIFKGS